MVELVAPEQVQVRSGSVVIIRGGIDAFGLGGWYWQKRAHAAIDGAYYFSFDTSKVYPMANNYGVRYYTFPLRCLAD